MKSKCFLLQLWLPACACMPVQPQERTAPSPMKVSFPGKNLPSQKLSIGRRHFR